MQSLQGLRKEVHFFQDFARKLISCKIFARNALIARSLQSSSKEWIKMDLQRLKIVARRTFCFNQRNDFFANLVMILNC